MRDSVRMVSLLSDWRELVVGDELRNNVGNRPVVEGEVVRQWWSNIEGSCCSNFRMMIELSRMRDWLIGGDRRWNLRLEVH